MRASLLERAVVRALPLAPPPLVSRVAARYVAGEELADAVRWCAELQAGGMLATVDLLGEDVTADARPRRRSRSTCARSTSSARRGSRRASR